MSIRFPKNILQLGVAGVGAVVAEQTFKENENGQYCYHSSRGGGSVWNTLAHLAQIKVRTMAFGVYAPDDVGKETKDELGSLGIDTDGLSRKPDKFTRVFTQWLPQASHDNSTEPQHNFSLECPVCSRIRPRQEIALYSSTQVKLRSDYELPAIFCFDRITKDTSETARNLRSRGSLTVIDVGGTSGYTKKEIPRLTRWLKNFNLVNMPSEVVSWFEDKEPQRFVDSLLTNSTDLVSVTKGCNGFYLCFNNSGNQTQRWIGSAPESCDVIDSTGAGDAHLAALVSCVLAFSITSSGLNKVQFKESHREKILESLKYAALPTINGVGARSALPVRGFNRSWSGSLDKHRNQALGLLKEKFSHARPCIFCRY